MGHRRGHAWIVGMGGTVLVTTLCMLGGDRVDDTMAAMLLLLPILATSVVGGWRPAIVVALVAGAAYALTFLHPIGQIRIGWTRDVLVGGTFVSVAVIVGLVAGRREPPSNDEPPVVLQAISHDLRSPLNTIRTASAELLGRTHDQSDSDELLRLIISESDRLDRIVGNLLHVSRIRAGTLVPQIESENVEALLHSWAGRLERLSEHPITVEADRDLPAVSIDAVLIDQVVTNLVENATRASPPHAPVSIRATVAGRFVEVAVVDCGSGFSPADAAEALAAYRSRTGSTGLGLAVCKAVVEAHHGTIRVEPGPRGCVVFTLPIA